MGGIMWALRWVAATSILTNCVVMTVDAALEARSFELTHSKPLVAPAVEVR
jgi:hypothetical protein